MSTHGVQDLTFETVRRELFESMLAAANDAMQCSFLFRTTHDRIWQYPSHAAAFLLSFLGQPPLDLARWAAPDQRPAAHYLPICRLARAPQPRPHEEAIAVPDRAHAVQAAIDLVRAADLAAFERATGDGPFQGCDGTVVGGYRVHGGALANDLTVSLCHIYHPK